MIRLVILYSIFLSPFLLQAQGAVLLHQRADSLSKSNQYANAIVQYQSAQQDFLRQKNWAAYLGCQASIGQALIYLSKFAAAEDTLLKAERMYEARFSRKKNPPIATLYDIRLALANVTSVTGRVDQALKILSGLRANVTTDLHGNYLVLGRIEYSIGFCKTSQAAHIEARDHLFKSLKAFREGNALTSQPAMFAYFGLGQAYENLNDYDSALECYAAVDKWLKSQTRPANHMKALLNNALGRAYAGIGDYQQALEYHQRSLAADRKLFGNKNRATINDLQRLGNVYLLRNEWNNALTHYRQALLYLDSLYAIPIEGRAILFSKIAATHAGLGQPDTAKIYWERALDEAGKIPQNSNLVEIHHGLANFYLQQEQYTAAIAELRVLEAQLAGQSSYRFVELCRTKTLIGRALLLQKNYEEALKRLQEALLLQCRPGTQLENFDNPTQDQIFISENTLPTFACKAEALFFKPGIGTARHNNLTLALKTVQYAVQLGERFRQNFHRSRNESSEWVDRYQALFNTGIAAAQELYLLTKDPAYWQQAFMLADQSKALLLSEGIQNAEAKSFAGIPWSIVREELGLTQAIAYQERMVMEAGAQKDATLLSAETQKLLDKKQAYNALIKRMETEYPYYFEQKYRPLRASAAEIQATLAPDVLFVEYQANPQKGLLYIFTISKRTGLQLTIERLNKQAGTWVEELNRLLQSASLQNPTEREQFVRVSSALYEQYITPIEQALQGKKRMIVVGGGNLNYLPFEVLTKSNAVLPYQDLNYLVRRVSISYHYSAALYLRLQRKGTPVGQEGMLMFAPTFPEQPTGLSEALGSSAAASFRSTTTGDSNAIRYFPPLPYATEEVRRISALFKDQPVIMLLGDQATKTALKAALQQPRRIAHIASHSFVDALLPRFSGIACSFPAQEKNMQDSILYSADLYNMSIPADLVVLSSCESGAGKANAGEGVLGLNRSFIFAGAANIVFSLWRASDQTTSDFMAVFYQELADKNTYPAALRAAKLNMIEDPLLASPNFWAGFLLIGR